MAERIANFSIRLKGGATAVTTGKQLADELERSQAALEMIRKKTEAFDALRKRAQAAERELKKVNKELSNQARAQDKGAAEGNP